MDSNYILSPRQDIICYILEYLTRCLTSYLHKNMNDIEYVAKYLSDNENDQDYIDRSINYINYQIRRYNEEQFEVKINVINNLYEFMLAK